MKRQLSRLERALKANKVRVIDSGATMSGQSRGLGMLILLTWGDYNKSNTIQLSEKWKVRGARSAGRYHAKPAMTIAIAPQSSGNSDLSILPLVAAK